MSKKNLRAALPLINHFKQSYIMQPSIKNINIGETLQFSHVEHRKGAAIICFKDTHKQVVVLDPFVVAALSTFEDWLTDPRCMPQWAEVEIECYYHTPIETVCAYEGGSVEFNRFAWVRGFDPYTAFVNIVYKSVRNEALLL